MRFRRANLAKIAKIAKIANLAKIAILALLLCSCGPKAPAKTDSAHSVELSDLTDDAYRWADSLLERMTVGERVGQLVMPSIYASGDAATLRRLRQYAAQMHVGGVVLLKGDLNSAAVMARAMQRQACGGAIVAIDAEWGLAMRLSDAPHYPSNGSLGRSADEELMFDYGREIARECRRVGINMLLGPVVDVVPSGGSGVIGKRSFGSDPHRVADLAVAYAAGVESGGVVSVAKHFPGHGSPKGDSHRTLPVVDRDLAELDSVDLYPFRQYIDRGLSGVMVGHLAVPALDSVARPAAVSPVVVGDMLRGKLGFRGLVLTDALNMAGASGYGAVDAIMAGADIVVAPADTEVELKALLEAVAKGKLAMETVNERCRRILFYKYLLGVGRERELADAPGPDAGSDAGYEDLHEDVSSSEADSIGARLRRAATR